MTPPADRLWDVFDVAYYCKWDVKSPRHHANYLVKKGQFPEPVTMGRDKRWTKQQIDDFLFVGGKR
jgi:hypothetical protein